MDNDHCEKLASPNIANFAVSLFILIGLLISYLPQHLRIIQRRSSAGLSPYFVLLGTTSGTCAIANIIVLPTSRADAACCKELSPFACAAGLLGIAQVGAQWCCFFLIFFLFLIFFPRNAAEQESLTAHTSSAPSFRDAIVVAVVSMIHFFIVIFVSVYVVFVHQSWTQWWANILGLVASVLAMTQYIPQIWTTWRLQEIMSLSVPMMLIQTPGSFVFAASLGVRLGAEGWSAWSVYVVTGILQGILLVICIRFMLRDRKTKIPGDQGTRTVNGQDGHNPEANNETTPLLSHD